MEWRRLGLAIFLIASCSSAPAMFLTPSHAEPLLAGKNAQATVAADPFATNKDVLKTCSASQGSGDYLLCLGYVHGLLRRDELLRWTNPNLAYACELPEGVDVDQVRAVIVKYLQDRPETWHWSGAGSSLYAVKRAFCRPTR